MCSILWWILYISEAICWNFSHFALIHALSTRGRSLCIIWAHGSIWKVFKVVWAVFEKFGAGPVSWGGLTASFWKVWCRVGLLGQSNRPQAIRSQRGDLTALGKVSRIFLFVAFPCCITALVQGECALAQGELAYVQGSSLCCSSFGLEVCALCLSIVLSRMCRAVALA
jgi:hypothetical protein